MRLAIKALLLDHAAEVLDVVAEHELAESLVPVQLGIDSAAQAHERSERMARATREAESLIDREQRGEAVRPPFRGVLQALRAIDDYRTRMADGMVRRSRLEQTDTDTERGEGAASMVERHVDAVTCWDACLATGWTLVTSPVRAALSSTQARAVVVLATLGLPGDVRAMQWPQPRSGVGVRQSQPKGRVHVRGAPVDGGTFLRGQDPTDAQIAAHASEQFGVHVPIGHVVQLRAEGLRQMHARLAERGLVPHSGGLTTMTTATRLEDLDLHGWKSIRAVVGEGTYDERTLRAWSRRAEDPLPLYEVRGEVCAMRAELAEWSKRELARSRRVTR